jgi:hypothetical protein
MLYYYKLAAGSQDGRPRSQQDKGLLSNMLLLLIAQHFELVMLLSESSVFVFPLLFRLWLTTLDLLMTRHRRLIRIFESNYLAIIA